MSIQFITYYKPFKINQVFIRNWWIFMIRGLLSIAFGLLALALPDLTLPVLLLIIGGFISMTSLLVGTAIISTRKSLTHWRLLLASVALCFVAAVMTFVNPVESTVTGMYIVGACVFMAGTSEMIMADRLRRVIHGEGWYIFAGVVEILFALLIFFNPFAAESMLTVIFGIYAVIAGIMLVYLSYRLKNLDSFHHQGAYNLL